MGISIRKATNVFDSYEMIKSMIRDLQAIVQNPDFVTADVVDGLKNHSAVRTQAIIAELEKLHQETIQLLDNVDK